MKLIAEKYEVVKKIGQGGFGAVYLARHIDLGLPFAVKLITEGKGQDEKFRERFRREAQVLTRLLHKNSVALRDFGYTEEGYLYMALDYCPGRSLKQEVEQKGPVAPHRGLNMVRQILEVLVEAHDMGIVHRDLKPANLMIEMTPEGEEVVKVLDFGLAKMARQLGTAPVTLTKDGAILGTPMYMAPEQAEGLTVGPKTDIYSLGMTLYNLLTGCDPFVGDSEVQILMQQIHQYPQPMTQRRSDLHIPPQLDQFVFRAIDKNPAHRFAGVQEMHQVCVQLLSQLPQNAPPAYPAASGTSSSNPSLVQTRFDGDTASTREREPLPPTPEESPSLLQHPLAPILGGGLGMVILLVIYIAFFLPVESPSSSKDKDRTSSKDDNTNSKSTPSSAPSPDRLLGKLRSAYEKGNLKEGKTLIETLQNQFPASEQIIEWKAKFRRLDEAQGMLKRALGMFKEDLFGESHIILEKLNNNYRSLLPAKDLELVYHLTSLLEQHFYDKYGKKKRLKYLREAREAAELTKQKHLKYIDLQFYRIDIPFRIWKINPWLKGEVAKVLRNTFDTTLNQLDTIRYTYHQNSLPQGKKLKSWLMRISMLPLYPPFRFKGHTIYTFYTSRNLTRLSHIKTGYDYKKAFLVHRGPQPIHFVVDRNIRLQEKTKRGYNMKYRTIPAVPGYSSPLVRWTHERLTHSATQQGDLFEMYHISSKHNRRLRFGVGHISKLRNLTSTITTSPPVSQTRPYTQIIPCRPDDFFIASTGGVYRSKNRRYTAIAHLYLDGKTYAPPLYEGHHIYVGTDRGTIHSLHAPPYQLDNSDRNLAHRWKYTPPQPAPIRSRPLLVGEKLFFANQLGHLYCLSAETGKKIWDLEFPGEFSPNMRTVHHPSPQIWHSPERWKVNVSGKPHTWKKYICLGGPGNNVYLVDIDRGEKVWTFDTEGPVMASPLIWANCAIVGDLKGNLYCLDLTARKVKWKVRAQGEFTTQVQIFGRHLYYATTKEVGIIE